MKQTKKILSFAALLSLSAHDALTARSVTEEVHLNSPASVFVEDKSNLSIEAGLLLWRAYQEDLSSYANGEVHELSPSLQRGFRVSIAPVLPHDDWGLFAQWTRLRNSTSNELCSKNELSPLFSPAEASFFAPYTTKNEWQIRIDLLQVEQGRPFFIGKSLILDPFIGLLGTILQQQTHIETQFSSSLAPLSAGGSESDLLHRFRGLGPRGGIRVRCPMGKEMSFLAISALSLLYGHYRVEAESCSFACFSPGGETQTAPSCLKDSFFTTKGATDISVGFEWKRAYMEESWALGLQLLWDQWIFLSQNALIGIEEQLFASSSRIDHRTELLPRKGGDLTLQGITVMAGIDF